MSMILQNFTTALITLVIVSLAFFALEEQYFAHYHAPAGTVTQTIPVLTPLLPLGLPHSVVQKFPVFLVYQQNMTMLQHAFDSAQEAFPNQVVIIDNSATTEVSTSLVCSVFGAIKFRPNRDFKHAAAIWHTVTYLSFPQLHNTMAALAAAWRFEVYAWMHADAVVLKAVPEEDLGSLALQSLESLGMSWAVAFTVYDVLAFYNNRVVLKEPWDEHYLQNYIADCDAYNRWRMAGHKQMELEASNGKHFKVVHLADVPPKRWGQMTSEQRWELYPPLDKANLPHNLDRNQWKWSSESSKRAMAAQQRRFEAGRAYYFDKWGTGACDVPLTTKPAFNVPPSIMYKSMAGKMDATAPSGQP